MIRRFCIFFVKRRISVIFWMLSLDFYIGGKLFLCLCQRKYLHYLFMNVLNDS